MEFRSRRPLVPVTLALMAGVGLGSVMPAEWWLGWVIAFCGCGAGWLFAARWSEGAGHALTLAGVGLAGVALVGILGREGDLRVAHRPDGAGEIVGRVATMPELRGGGEGQARLEFVLAVEWARREEGLWEPSSGRVRVVVRGGSAERVLYGQRVRVVGRARGIEPAMNPGEFDALAYWMRKGVRLECRVDPEAVHDLSGESRGWVAWLAGRLRAHMRETLAHGLEGDRKIAAVIAGMLYGDRAGFDDRLLETFRRTGTMHLFAVSGQNVGVIAVAGIGLLRWAGLNRWRWGWVVVPVLGLYTLATGAQASAVRAFGMAAMVLLAWVMDRPVGAGQLLAGAAFVMLLSEATQAWDVGFQLSFSVVLALVVLTAPIYRRLLPVGAPDPFLPRRLWPVWLAGWERARRAVAGTVAASVAAFLGSAPLSAWYFHMVSPAGVAVNVAVVPLAAVVVVVGACSLAGGVVHPLLAVVCNRANWLVASAIVGVVEFAAGLPLGCVNVGSPVWGEAEVVALAVGPGQAAIVRTGDGCEVFDCAGVWQARGIVAPALRYYGVNRIERLWLGHGDAAHVGGAEALLANWPVGRLIVPGSDVGRGTLAGVVARHATRARVARRGDVLGDRRLRWVVLWPDRDTIGSLADDRGIVARMEWEGGALLFLGDAGASVERELMASGANLRADIILAGRHAREGGLTAEFLDAVGPRHVVFNAGWRAGERLDGGQHRRLEERGILLWDLSETGAVEIRCGKEGARVGAPYQKRVEPRMGFGG